MMPSPRQLHTESPITSEWQCLQSNLASWERETLIWRSGCLGVGSIYFFIPQKPLAEYKISHSPLILGTEIKFRWHLILPKNTALCAVGLCPEVWQMTVFVPLHGGGDAPPEKGQLLKRTISPLPSFSSFVCKIGKRLVGIFQGSK